MRIAVVAPGTVGGRFGALLPRAEEEVRALARGAHLAAIRERGLRVEGPDGGPGPRLPRRRFRGRGAARRRCRLTSAV